jgi:hypothetical protein
MSKATGRPFEVGNSVGRGRPKGSRNKTTLPAQELLRENADAITRKCLLMALKGDTTAMRLCMERIHPVRRAMPVRFNLPAIRNLQQLPAAVNSVAQAVAKGELTTAEGQQILPLLESLQRILATEEFEARLRALEDRLGLKGVSRIA